MGPLETSHCKRGKGGGTGCGLRAWGSIHRGHLRDEPDDVEAAGALGVPMTGRWEEESPVSVAL
jgi:hypothetical protein